MARPPSIPQPLRFELGLVQSGNIVDLKTAGLVPADLGGVYIESAKGLGIALDGKLSGLVTTPTTIGMLFDAPYDGKTYNRIDGAWVESSTVPPGTLPIADYDSTGVVSIVPNRALRIEPTGALDVLPASPTQLGVILDPPFDSGKPDVTYVRKWGTWVETVTVTPVLAIEFIVPNTAPVKSAPVTVSVHGTKFTATTLVYVDGVNQVTTMVSPTELSFQIDPLLETVRTATITVQDTVGPVTGIGDAKFYFTAVTAPYVWGIGIDESTTTPGTINLVTANTNGEIGGIKVIGRSPLQGLDLAGDGLLTAPLATDVAAGTIVEPLPDGKNYVRNRSVAGVSTWVENISSGGIIIADAPPPGAVHGDTWWESDTGKYYVYYTDVDTSQWVQISGGGGGTYNITGVEEAPVDTKLYGRQDATWVEVVGGAGGIGEAPIDTKQYARQDAAWSEIVIPPAMPIVPVADVFPASPVQGQLHFLSTDASLYIWFVDASSVGSWVEVSAP